MLAERRGVEAAVLDRLDEQVGSDTLELRRATSRRGTRRRRARPCGPRARPGRARLRGRHRDGCRRPNRGLRPRPSRRLRMRPRAGTGGPAEAQRTPSASTPAQRVAVAYHTALSSSIAPPPPRGLRARPTRRAAARGDDVEPTLGPTPTGTVARHGVLVRDGRYFGKARTRACSRSSGSGRFENLPVAVAPSRSSSTAGSIQPPACVGVASSGRATPRAARAETSALRPARNARTERGGDATDRGRACRVHAVRGA